MSRKSTENINYSKSKGQTLLYEEVKKVYPDKMIKQDINLGKFFRKQGYSWSQFSKEYGKSLSPLIADIVVFDNPLIILEYNGQQHYKYTSHWHGDIDGYKMALERDNQKIWLCQRLMIPIVTFDYKEDINEYSVKQKVKKAIDEVIMLDGYKICDNCKRIFLEISFQDDICNLCLSQDKYREINLQKQRELREAQKKKQENDPFIEEKKRIQKEKQKELKEKYQLEKPLEYIEEQKEKQQEQRKIAMKKYKESDYYQEQKEKQKELRKELYKRQKEQRKKY